MDGPRSCDGELVLETVQALGGQMRIIAGMGGAAAVGLDMGAALALGEAKGCDMELLAGVLPSLEAALMARHAGDGEEGLRGDESEWEGDRP